MGEKQFTYEINGTTYIQRPLVLGQIKQLSNVLENISVSMLTDETAMAKLLVNNISPVIAVVITKEGVRLQDKDIEAFSGEIEFAIDAETVTRVVQDFFVCNPVASIYEKLSGMVKSIRKGKEKQAETGSTGPASSSPAETSQNGTGSSGDTPQGNVSPGSNTDPGT
ncbi:MAG: hypothetical protein PHC90_12615 [Syntrophorhabdaceae bacterium]|nr:hypothetical protein [Syntrophorhabdaceae bacterium]